MMPHARRSRDRESSRSSRAAKSGTRVVVMMAARWVWGKDTRGVGGDGGVVESEAVVGLGDGEGEGGEEGEEDGGGCVLHFLWRGCFGFEKRR